MCVLIFTRILFQTFVILKGIQPHTVVDVKKSSCEVPLILLRFELNFNFLKKFSEKKLKCQILPELEAVLFHSDRETSRHDKANSSFLQVPESA